MIAMLSAFILAVILPVQPQVSFSAGVEAHVSVPTIRFEAEPPLVVVQPGVMVVPDYDREVFFANGFYWYYDGGVWFRTRHHHGGWVRVNARYVPRAIVRYPRGRYVHYHGGRPFRRAVVYRRGRPAKVVRINRNGRIVKRKRRHRH